MALLGTLDLGLHTGQKPALSRLTRRELSANLMLAPEPSDRNHLGPAVWLNPFISQVKSKIKRSCISRVPQPCLCLLSSVLHYQ